ncbi:hypothetical protein [Microcoleus asticus]|uniref:Uncharacterized protein n=1 Tax=Microcoleus asticus IPMA8 TaxID=2563858 RepID=A0ABX2D3Y2_9CYAN|nr:hypothetical protein [Microcoleus asticus]NQE37344.1 hypothetical protein [Microcoleus asticus IPMA8]
MIAKTVIAGHLSIYIYRKSDALPKKADYVVTLKSNHPTLYNQVKTWFEMAKSQQFEAIEVSQDSLTEKGHHRSSDDREHLTFAAKLEIGVGSQEPGARRKEE